MSWEKTAEQFAEHPQAGPALPGLATERELQRQEAAALAVHLKDFRIERPRQWGACWVALRAWNLMKLSEFWSRLKRSTAKPSRVWVMDRGIPGKGVSH